MNKTPKLLPWLARKAGISTEKATTLWSMVASDKALQTAAKDPDCYCRLIVERLKDLAARETPVVKPTSTAHSPLLVLSRHGDASSAILLNPFGLKSAA